jgi:hypothetical protein
MGNQLFQSAREAVMNVVNEKHDSSSEHNTNSIDAAKNALSSAYANSTEAEKKQLRELQEQLLSKNDQ